MNIHIHTEQGSNTYIIWKKNEQKCILIDPVIISNELFEFLESNELLVSAVLFTRVHAHTRALQTIPNIYPDVQCYGGENIPEYASVLRKIHGDVRLHGFTIESIFYHGHTSDFLMFKVENFLFVGEVLQAGEVVWNEYLGSAQTFKQKLVQRLRSLPPYTFIFSQYGPPSSVEIELENNAGLLSTPILPQYIKLNCTHVLDIE